MRILIIFSGLSVKGVLVSLPTQELINDVKDLIGRRKHSEAIDIVLRDGMLEREIETDDFEILDANLILRRDSAHWDATR